MAQAETAKQNSPIPNDVDPAETAEWLESLDYVLERKGTRARATVAYGARASGDSSMVWNCRSRPPRRMSTRFRTKSSRAIPAIAKSNAASRASFAGTRWRWSFARIAISTASAATSRRTPRRPTCTKWHEPLLPRPRRKRLRRRSDLFPGPRFARHVCPCVSRRPADRTKLDELPPRAAARRRVVVLSASLADARLLGIPHGLDGPRPDHGDLPGALQSLPDRSRHRRSFAQARVGVSWATANATSPNRSARSRSPRAKSSTT